MRLQLWREQPCFILAFIGLAGNVESLCRLSQGFLRNVGRKTKKRMVGTRQQTVQVSSPWGNVPASQSTAYPATVLSHHLSALTHSKWSMLWDHGLDGLLQGYRLELVVR